MNVTLITISIEGVDLAFLIQNEEIVEIFRHSEEGLQKVLTRNDLAFRDVSMGGDDLWRQIAEEFITDVFSGRPTIPPPHRLRGVTDFQKRILELTSLIPLGFFTTYKELGRVFSPRHARAVGQCVARNPLPLIIPCHRVLASDFGLGGFGWGIEVKRILLQAESRRALEEPYNIPFKIFPLRSLKRL